MTQCKGMNCGTTTGNHSPECRAEHAAAVAGGMFVKGGALTIDDIQRKSIEYGFQYWRASDAHGVTGHSSQAVRLLEDLIGVEVDIEDAPESTRRTKEPITGEWMKRRDGEDLETWSLRVSFRNASEEIDAIREALGMQEDCDYGEMIEMIETLRAEAEATTPSAPAVDAGAMPNAVIAWRDAFQEYKDAVAAYNAHLEYVKTNCPLGTSVDKQYQAMNDAQRKAMSLIAPMHTALSERASETAAGEITAVDESLGGDELQALIHWAHDQGGYWVLDKCQPELDALRTAVLPHRGRQPQNCGCSVSYLQCDPNGDLQRIRVHYGDGKVAELTSHPAASGQKLTDEQIVMLWNECRVNGPFTVSATVLAFARALLRASDSATASDKEGVSHE